MYGHPTFAKTLSTPYTFAESTNQNQTQRVTISNLSQVNSVTVDNGNVTYSVDGNDITLNLSKGTGYQVQTGGTYTPADSKTVTDTRSTSPGGSSSSLPSSISYNSGGYTGTLTGGTATVTSGTYTPADSKTVTDTRSTSPGGSSSSLPSSISYNSGGYTGTLTGGTATVTSGTYTPADSKTVTDTRSTSPGGSSSSLPSSISYNSGGYTGTLTGGTATVTSGTYTPADSKTVTDTRSTSPGGSSSSLPSSISYNSGGYTGTLTGGTATVTSGTYTPADSKTVTDTRSTSPGGSSSSLPSSISYNSGGYTGTLTGGTATVTSGTYTPADSKTITDYPLEKPKGSGPNAFPSTVNYNSGGYSGTLTKYFFCGTCNVDVMYYEGTVTKPASDTRVWTKTYSGTVTKPAVDTRVWTKTYSGTVTKPAVDTRTYETRYQYKVTINYNQYSGTNPSLTTNAGINLNGVDQYFNISNSSQYKISKNISIGIMFKPTSTSIDSRQNLLSDTEGGGIAITLQPNFARTYVYINGAYQTVDIPINLIGLNKWNYIMMTYNGSTINMYLNGDFVSSKSVTGTIAYPNMDWNVGAEPGATSPSYFFKGQIENVRIWNRVLSSTEISNASNQSYSTSGLVGAWIFDSNTTGKSYDISNYQNDAIGKGFSPTITMSASNVDDLGATLNWSSVSGSTSYLLQRDGSQVYKGTNTSYIENALASETNYNYSITPIFTHGEGVSATKTITTLVGSLSLESVPSNINISNVVLNGKTQKIYGSFGQKLIVKDTRKTRDGWKIRVKATNFKSADGLRTFPSNSIDIKPVISINQTKGLMKGSPTITSSNQFIDNTNGAIIISADSTDTGYGIYEISFPSNVLEINIDPKYGFSNIDKSALEYSTKITWTVESGN
ncbi:LamG-like jellyroll fold domain-containing protein [Heyndrickxia camelliae]|uniref:LamG-like jellyroll fold domain-containing protein n=1 Tax=Heyndrickxia camelliae TaxID=1707093 RepID=UPI0013FD1D0D|nr:LamG-like jellyroll fold domain-containing protein [Heyndrickxia camelliae]